MASVLGMSSLHPQSIYMELKESCSDDDDEPPPPPPPMLPPPLLHCARSSSDDIERRARSPDKLSQERSTHAFDLIRLQHPSCSTLEGSERSRTARHSAGSSDLSVLPSGGAPASAEGHSSMPPASPRKASTLGELPSPQAMKLTQRNLEFHRLKHTALHSPPASSHGHREGSASRKPGHSRSKSVDPWLLKGAKLMRMFEGRPGDGADSEDDKSECSSNCAVGSALSIGSALFAGLGSIAKARYLGSKDGGKRAKEVWSELAPHADALKESAQTAAASKFHSVVGNELGNFLRTLGKKGREMVIEEDYLPGWFRAMGLRMFENIWPQIEREMHDILMQQLGRQLNVRPEVFKQEAEPVRWKPNVAVYLRSKLRYTLYPYDKSVFQVMRNPWCVVLMTCSVFPYFGIQPLYYLVVFCCIDKSDEFQLVAFVLEIKAFSCFTIGYLLLILGAAQDHLCITWLTEPLCDDFGPGVSPAFAWELLGFVVQTLLFFVGFLCLPFSSSRTEDPNNYSEAEALERHREVLDLLGANKDHYLITKKPTGICLKLFDCMFPGGDYSRGGMLYPWMVYDASVLFLTILLAVFFIHHGARIDEEFWQDQWRLHAIIWWWKTCYGLLETPFLIFTVTRMSSFLTYAQPTGYDRQGKLVRQLTRAERRQRYDDLQQEFQVGTNQSKGSPMPARSQSHGCTRSPSVCRSAKQWSDSFAPLLAGKSEAGKWRDKHSTSTSSRLNMLARKGLSILLSHLPPREGMGDDVRGGSRDDNQTGSSAIDERPHGGNMSNSSGHNLTPVDKLLRGRNRICMSCSFLEVAGTRMLHPLPAHECLLHVGVNRTKMVWRDHPKAQYP